jgi:Uma2 family endonuclease
MAPEEGAVMQAQTSGILEYPQRHAVSATEYLRMGEAGVFAPEARLELIEGEIVEMTPIGSRHAGAVNTLNRLLVRLAGDRAIVSVQNPAIVSDRSVPQPEQAVRVYRDPSASGYKTSFTVAGESSVPSLVLPDVRIVVSDLFPR